MRRLAGWGVLDYKARALSDIPRTDVAPDSCIAMTWGFETMRNRIGISLGIVALVGLVYLGGCAGLLPTITLPIQLGGNSQFDVVAGTPVAKTFTTTFNNDTGLAIGRGSIAVDPSALSGTPAAAKTLQATVSCADACELAGALADLCNNVCGQQEVAVTVWVGLANESDPQQTGDQYGPFYVGLDDGNNGVSVTPDSVELQEKTLQALAEEAATITVEVVSPFTGTIALETIALNAGL
jgi:hypothetical protein